MKRPNTAGAVRIAMAVVAAVASVTLAGANGDAPHADAEAKTNCSAGSLLATNIPLAVFDVEAKIVKDPFFPLSTRSPVPVPVSTNVEPQQINYKSFELRGMLTSSDGSALALIGTHPFAEGETFELLPTGATNKVNVTVTKIKEHSAVIRVEGYPEPIEIKMRDN